MRIKQLYVTAIAILIIVLFALLLVRLAHASSPEPYIVRLWWAYCVDHATPFFVKPDSFPFSNPEYNYLEVSCMTMNANYQWKESWWRHCQGVSPQVRHRWVSPWSVLIGCFDEIGVGE